MTRRKIPFVTGEYFHVYNRGNSKQKIFLDDEDKERFVKLLYIHNTKKGVSFRDDIIKPHLNAWDFEKGAPIVSVGAWVLMQNHFHLYITSLTSGLDKIENNQESSVSLFMNKLCTSYSKYFNKKYSRVGSLFEGRFKAVHIEDEIQAKYLFSYIHLNPVKLIDSTWKEDGIKDKIKTLKFLSEYKWSSYLDYKGLKRSENKILNRENFLNYFSNISSFDREILDWINIK